MGGTEGGSKEERHSVARMRSELKWPPLSGNSSKRRVSGEERPRGVAAGGCRRCWDGQAGHLVEVEANAEEDTERVILQFSVIIIDEDIIRGNKVAAVHGNFDSVGNKLSVGELNLYFICQYAFVFSFNDQR